MKTKFLSFFTILFLLTIIVACTSEDKVENAVKVNVTDEALISALKELGFEFEGNSLKQTKKVKQSKSLDLSGKKISNLEGIKAFESLEEINLANNSFDMEFDFAQLPQGVKAIDLQGNDLYEFYNISSDRTITKLYLPEKARFNMEEVLDFYKANKEAVDKGSIDMKMMVKGALKPYNSLREIPDSDLRKYMQKQFPSLFENSGDLIDIAIPMRVPENTVEFHVEAIDDADKGLFKIENFEGIQYILQHKDYGATWFEIMYKYGSKEINNSIEYLKIPQNGVGWIWLGNFHIPKGINVTSEALSGIKFENVTGFKTLDLSASSNFFVGGGVKMSTIRLADCPDIEEVIIPKSNLSEPQIGQIILINLPNLQKADLSYLDNFWGGSTFEKIPRWNPEYPQKLTNRGKKRIRLYFDKEPFMTTYKDKTVELLRKVAESTTRYKFHCSVLDDNNKSTTYNMDKDGNLLDEEGNIIQL